MLLHLLFSPLVDPESAIRCVPSSAWQRHLSLWPVASFVAIAFFNFRLHDKGIARHDVPAMSSGLIPPTLLAGSPQDTLAVSASPWPPLRWWAGLWPWFLSAFARPWAVIGILQLFVPAISCSVIEVSFASGTW